MLESLGILVFLIIFIGSIIWAMMAAEDSKPRIKKRIK